MGVTVVPYNPWKENLAVNVLGGLLNNLLEQNRQAEQNRKVNAFRGQLQQDLANNIAQQQENAALSLAQPDAPAGYNANPWTGAAHESYSPLTPFDIGTSVIPMRDPTIREIDSTADTLGASRRFSMINPETIQNIKTGMLQQAEAQRIRNLQDMYAEQLRNAPDLASQMNIAGQAAMRGVMPYQGITPFATGIAAQLDANAKRDVQEMRGIADRDVANINAGAKREGDWLDFQVRQYIANQNRAGTEYAAKLSADVQNRHYANEENKLRLTAIKDRRTQLAEQLSQLDLQNTSSPEAAELVRQQKAAIQSELDQLKNEEDKLLNGWNSYQVIPMSGEASNSWFDLAGNPKDARITSNFGVSRPNGKTHGGIDIGGIVEGTDIRAFSKMGDSLIVREAYKSGSYGNNVLLESNRKINGKSLKFRIAHMQDGSLNLKPGQTVRPGDIIGKVGSTGRSTGAHIHLEVLVGDKPIDPASFFDLQEVRGAAAKQSQPQAQATQAKANMVTTKPQSGGIPYLFGSDGSYITWEEFNEEQRKLNIPATTLLSQLEDRGYSEKPYSNVSQTTQANNTTSAVPPFVPSQNWLPSHMTGSYRTAPMVTPPTSGDVAQTTQAASQAAQTATQEEQPQVIPMGQYYNTYRGSNKSGLTPYAEKNNTARRYNPWNILPFRDSQPQYYIPPVNQNQQGISSLAMSVPPTGVLGIDNLGTQVNAMDFPYGYYGDSTYTGQGLGITPDEYSSPLGLYWWNLPAVRQFRH